MLFHRTTRTSLLLFCALLLTLALPTASRAALTPRVLAFYYTWYDSNTWNPALVSDMPAEPYNSSDPAAISRHVQQARSAGIDAFVASWIGTNNPTDSNFRTLLDIAAGSGFQATIDLEVQHFGSRDAVIGALTYVRDTLAPHPAFLREGGKPVLFFWREQNLSVSDWAAIRAAVDPNHNQIWVAEGTNISYLQVFDGHHLYSVAWSANPAAVLASWSARVRNAGSDKIWVATVMPGYDDTRTTRADRFARPRDNGNWYRTTWQAAINSSPDYIIVNSFNEWVEGSMIEPSSSYGRLYLDLTAQFAAQFKSGAPVAAPAQPVASAPAPTAAPTSTPTPTLAPNQRLTTEILRVRSGPGTDYEVLGRLRQHVSVEVLGRSEDSAWLRIVYSRSEDGTGWISSEYVTPTGEFDSFPIVSAPELPAPTPVPDDWASYDSPYPPWY